MKKARRFSAILLTLGAVIALVAGFRALSKDKSSWEEWATIGAGALAILLPFILSLKTAATSTGLVIGAAVIVLAALQLRSTS